VTIPIKTKVTGLDELQAGLAAGQDTLRDEARKAMTTGLLLLEAEIKKRAPRDTGRLQGSVHHTITGSGANLTGRVGPSVAYALFVEKGTRAHYPPIAAISGWARRHGMSPYALARGIARRGTRAQPFVEPSLQAHRSAIRKLFEQVGLKVSIRIARGR
jgi:HK97 gp10 family phage protein